MNKGSLRWRPSKSTPETGRWYWDPLDGSKWITLDGKGGRPCFTRASDRAAVEKWRADFVAAMTRLGVTERRSDLTVADWFDLYYRAAAKGDVGRRNRGLPQVSADRRRQLFENHIRPLIGDLPMRDGSISDADIRRIVTELNKRVRERAEFYMGRRTLDDKTGKKPGISPKTAAAVWSELTNGFKEACTSEHETLRILTKNPTKGDTIASPNTGGGRVQAALYPSEVVRLLSCEKVPARRRLCYALAIYTGMRRSELERLTAADVDLEHAMIRIHGSKTDAATRRTPIEASLRPLIERLVSAYPKGPLVDVPRPDGKGGSSDLMKRDLQLARLDRLDLWRDNAQHMPFTFHGLRHTTITHAYVAGRDETFLKIAYGHTSTTMTRRYLDNESIGKATFGSPFPTIPTELIEHVPSEWTAGWTVGPQSTKAKRETQRISRSSHVAYGDPSGNRSIEDHYGNSPTVPAQVDPSGPPETAGDDSQRDRSVADLAAAIAAASAAGQWDVVRMLAGQLDAMRVESAGNVTPITNARRK